MSNRWYPLYQRGNPQLRVFLPNFWMKLVKPKEKVPPNVVHFHVPLEMTEFDVKNYLEKIYKVPVVEVRTELKNGELRTNNRYRIEKGEDYRAAYVTLPRDYEFKFPDFEKHLNVSLEDSVKTPDEDKRFIRTAAKRPGVPGWFRS